LQAASTLQRAAERRDEASALCPTFLSRSTDPPFLPCNRYPKSQAPAAELLVILAGKIGLLPDPIIGSNAQAQNRLY
jgi:hypothetical protein